MPRRSTLALAALATAAVPGLDVVATRSPQSTTADFQVTGVLDSAGRHWVVRCPLHATAGAALEAEVELLANLGPQVTSGALPFAVPEPAGFAALPEGGRAMVYRQLRGRPLDLGRLRPGPGLAADLGRSLAALHELPTAVVEDAGLPSYDAEEYRKRTLAVVDETARTGHVPAIVLARWERALEDVALWRFRTTPVHGDLADEHVLILDGEVSALLSFSEAHVGDPAVDLAWLLTSAPEDCLDTIEEAYALSRPESADTHLLDRAQLVSELALARWLLHGVNSGNARVVEDAVQMLTDLAEQVTGADPIGHREPVVVPGRAEDWADRDTDPPAATDGDEANDEDGADGDDGDDGDDARGADDAAVERAEQVMGARPAEAEGTAGAAPVADGTGDAPGGDAGEQPDDPNATQPIPPLTEDPADGSPAHPPVERPPEPS